MKGWQREELAFRGKNEMKGQARNNFLRGGAAVLCKNKKRPVSGPLHFAKLG
jgi:hypothetical protein